MAKRPDVSRYEAENNAILAKLEAGIPLTMEEETWLNDYEPTLLSDLPELGKSRMGDVSTDPRLFDAQMAALSALEDQAESGLSDADRFAMRQAEKDLNRQAKGRMDSVRQNMAMRGMGGSGLDLVAQMQAAQAADEAAATSSMQRQAIGSDNRVWARMGAGDLAGNMSREEYDRKARAAQAQDEIERFNTANAVNRSEYNNRLRNEAARANLEGRQGVASRNVGARNGFNQQTFQNKRDIAGLKYNANAAGANRQLDQYAMDREAEERRRAAAMGTAAQIGAAYIASDEKLKKNVRDLSDEEIEDFLGSLEPVSYQYKGGEKRHSGAIAGDLEKGSDMGRRMIVEIDAEGHKGIDTGDLLGALLSSVSYLHRNKKDA